MDRPIAFWALTVLTIVPTLATRADDRASKAEETRQKINQFSQSIVAPEMVGRNPAQDLEVVEQLPAIRAYLEETEKDFANEIATANQPYRNLAGNIQYIRERLDQFQSSVNTFASVEAVQADADHILKMAKMSVENQAPAYFREGNDISNRTESIRLRIRMLEKLKPKSKELATALDIQQKTAKEVKAIQQKLLKGIIDQNELPNDSYSGSDRKELLKLIDDTWKKHGGTEKVLGSGLIGSQWSRNQAWEIQNRTLYKVDRSRIQGFVLIAHDSSTVVCRRIQIQKDHTDNDRLSAWPISDPKASPDPIEMILRSKLKK